MTDRRTIENCQIMRNDFTHDLSRMRSLLIRTPKNHTRIRNRIRRNIYLLNRTIIELNTEIATKVYAANPYAH